MDYVLYLFSVFLMQKFIEPSRIIMYYILFFPLFYNENPSSQGNQR